MQNWDISEELPQNVNDNLRILRMDEGGPQTVQPPSATAEKKPTARESWQASRTKKVVDSGKRAGSWLGSIPSKLIGSPERASASLEQPIIKYGENTELTMLYNSASEKLRKILTESDDNTKLSRLRSILDQAKKTTTAKAPMSIAEMNVWEKLAISLTNENNFWQTLQERGNTDNAVRKMLTQLNEIRARIPANLLKLLTTERLDAHDTMRFAALIGQEQRNPITWIVGLTEPEQAAVLVDMEKRTLGTRSLIHERYIQGCAELSNSGQYPENTSVVKHIISTINAETPGEFRSAEEIVVKALEDAHKKGEIRLQLADSEITEMLTELKTAAGKGSNEFRDTLTKWGNVANAIPDEEVIEELRVWRILRDPAVQVMKEQAVLHTSLGAEIRVGTANFAKKTLGILKWFGRYGIVYGIGSPVSYPITAIRNTYLRAKQRSGGGITGPLIGTGIAWAAAIAAGYNFWYLPKEERKEVLRKQLSASGIKVSDDNLKFLITEEGRTFLNRWKPLQSSADQKIPNMRMWAGDSDVWKLFNQKAGEYFVEKEKFDGFLSAVRKRADELGKEPWAVAVDVQSRKEYAKSGVMLPPETTLGRIAIRKFCEFYDIPGEYIPFLDQNKAFFVALWAGVHDGTFSRTFLPEIVKKVKEEIDDPKTKSGSELWIGRARDTMAFKSSLLGMLTKVGEERKKAKEPLLPIAAYIYGDSELRKAMKRKLYGDFFVHPITKGSIIDQLDLQIAIGTMDPKVRAEWRKQFRIYLREYAKAGEDYAKEEDKQFRRKCDAVILKPEEMVYGEDGITVVTKLNSKKGYTLEQAKKEGYIGDARYSNPAWNQEWAIKRYDIAYLNKWSMTGQNEVDEWITSNENRIRNLPAIITELRGPGFNAYKKASEVKMYLIDKGEGNAEERYVKKGWMAGKDSKQLKPERIPEGFVGKPKPDEVGRRETKWKPLSQKWKTVLQEYYGQNEHLQKLFPTSTQFFQDAMKKIQRGIIGNENLANEIMLSAIREKYPAPIPIEWKTALEIYYDNNGNVKTRTRFKTTEDFLKHALQEIGQETMKAVTDKDVIAGMIAGQYPEKIKRRGRRR